MLSATTARALALLLVPLLAVGACAHRRGPKLVLPPCAAESGAREVAEAVEACVARGDALYAERAQMARLDAALAVYQEALSLSPTSTLVLARLTRAHVARAYGFPETGQDGYRLAREEGLRCLTGAADVQGAVDAAGGVFGPRAADAVDPEQRECLLWTTTAWARGVQDLGLEGASLDQKVLVALAERTLKLSAQPDDGQASATLGLALALPPSPLGPDLERAQDQLLAAIRARPDRLSPKVDLAVMVYGRRGDTDAWRRLLEEVAATDIKPEDPDALEDRRAVLRAQEALARGAPDPGAWWRP